jgi:hypothetical protein
MKQREAHSQLTLSFFIIILPTAATGCKNYHR